MNAGAKLALYGAGLVVAFGAAYGLASVIVPASFVADWVASGESHGDTETAAVDRQIEHASQAPEQHTDTAQQSPDAH